MFPEIIKLQNIKVTVIQILVHGWLACVLWVYGKITRQSKPLTLWESERKDEEGAGSHYSLQEHTSMS
jgi:hypothetical protein